MSPFLYKVLNMSRNYEETRKDLVVVDNEPHHFPVTLRLDKDAAEGEDPGRWILRTELHRNQHPVPYAVELMVKKSGSYIHYEWWAYQNSEAYRVLDNLSYDHLLAEEPNIDYLSYTVTTLDEAEKAFNADLGAIFRHLLEVWRSLSRLARFEDTD